MSMKNILCFGDSNTWGYNPADGSRFPHDVRWTGVLKRLLGESCNVIEEGLSGRTTVFDDKVEEGRCGRNVVSILLWSHMPLDMVVVMLGTNDMKKRFAATPLDSALGLELIIKDMKRSEAGLGGRAPEILVISPVPMSDGWMEGSNGEEMFGMQATVKSKGLARHYRDVAERQGCHFLDAGKVIRVSEIDCIHFEAEGHEKLAHAIAKKIGQIL